MPQSYRIVTTARGVTTPESQTWAYPGISLSTTGINHYHTGSPTVWAPTRKPLSTRAPIRSQSRATHSHYHLSKSTTSKPFKSSLFDYSSTTRSHFHQHSVRTTSSTIRNIIAWKTPKSYFIQTRPAVTRKYVQTTTEPTTKKTNFLSTLWRKENDQSITQQSSEDSEQSLPVYSGSGRDDPDEERGPIKPMNTLSEQAVQAGTGETFTYHVDGQSMAMEDEDYYYVDALPVYSRPTHPTTAKKVEIPPQLENSHGDYDEYDDPLPVYSRPDLPGYPSGENLEEALPTYSSPPATEDHAYDDNDILPVYSKPLPAESTTVNRVEEATTTRPDVVFPETSVKPSPEDPHQEGTTPTRQGTTQDFLDGATTPFLVFPSNTIRPIVENPFATPRTTERTPSRSSEPSEELGIDLEEVEADQTNAPSLSTSFLGITIPNIFTAAPTETTTRESTTSEALAAEVGITIEPGDERLVTEATVSSSVDTAGEEENAEGETVFTTEDSKETVSENSREDLEEEFSVSVDPNLIKITTPLPPGDAEEEEVGFQIDPDVIQSPTSINTTAAENESLLIQRLLNRLVSKVIDRILVCFIRIQ